MKILCIIGHADTELWRVENPGVEGVARGMGAALGAGKLRVLPLESAPRNHSRASPLSRDTRKS